jgi:hypothetical protein
MLRIAVISTIVIIIISALFVMQDATAARNIVTLLPANATVYPQANSSYFDKLVSAWFANGTTDNVSMENITSALYAPGQDKLGNVWWVAMFGVPALMLFIFTGSLVPVVVGALLIAGVTIIWFPADWAANAMLLVGLIITVAIYAFLRGRNRD